MASEAFKLEVRTPITREATEWVDALFRSRYRKARIQEPTNSIMVAVKEKARVKGACGLKERGRISTVAEGFAYEVFSRLYDPNSSTPLEHPAPDCGWVHLAHEVMDEFPTPSHTAGDPDMAAVATYKILEKIVPVIGHLIDQANDEEDGPVQGTDIARAVMAEAIEEANDETGKLKAMLQALQPGFGEAPPLHEQDSTHRLELASRLQNNKRFKRCLDLVGVLRRHAESNRSKRDRRGVTHLYGLEHGDNLARVLPKELASLKHKSLRTLTLARFAERQLQQYRLEGVENQGRGPMVLLVDESGSMRSGDRHDYAVAIAIASLTMCAKDNRACTIITFNSSIRSVYRLDAEGSVSCLNGPEVKSVADLAVRIATSTPRGGTDFERPLQYALNLDSSIKDDRADLILVTDGHANVPENILEELEQAKENEMRFFGFTVGGGSLGAAVQTICDRTIDIDLADNEEIGRALA